MYQANSENITKNHVPNEENFDDVPKEIHLENKAASESCQDSSAENTSESNRNCCLKWLHKFRLELVSFLFMFSWVMIQISSTSMILDKVCLVHYNYSSEICSNLDNYTEIKTELSKIATNYQLGRSLIQTAPAVLISCFVGPWSDKYGRIIPVLIAITGMTLDTLGSSTCAFFLYSRVEYFYIPAIFTGCLGGVVTVLTVIYSYASDVTPEGLKTMKFAFLEMSLGLSQPLGVGAGGWIFKFWGYPAVFIISAVGLAVCFVLIVFLLSETRGLDNYDPLKKKLKNLFTLKTLKEGFNATVKQRPNQGRKQVLLLIITMCFITIATNSTGNVNYLFVHQQYNWDNTKYSSLMAIYSAIGIVILVIVVPLFKYFRVGDSMLGLSGTISILLKYIGIGLAWKPPVFHIANVLGSLLGCAPLAGRSRISKLVPTEDIGKVFSFVATAEALLPVFSTIVISQVFIASLDFYPGMPYIILACCMIFPIGVFAWMTRLPNANISNQNAE